MKKRKPWRWCFQPGRLRKAATAAAQPRSRRDYCRWLEQGGGSIVSIPKGSQQVARGRRPLENHSTPRSLKVASRRDASTMQTYHRPRTCGKAPSRSPHDKMTMKIISHSPTPTASCDGPSLPRARHLHLAALPRGLLNEEPGTSHRRRMAITTSRIPWRHDPWPGWHTDLCRRRG